MVFKPFHSLLTILSTELSEVLFSDVLGTYLGFCLDSTPADTGLQPPELNDCPQGPSQL